MARDECRIKTSAVLFAVTAWVGGSGSCTEFWWLLVSTSTVYVVESGAYKYAGVGFQFMTLEA